MALLDHDSQFQKWVLTREEQLQGTILTITQKQCIQNQICELAHRRLSLTIDVNNILKTATEDAELSGQISSLQYLLTLSSHAEDELREVRLGNSTLSGES